MPGTLFQLTEQEQELLNVLSEHNGDADHPEVIEALEKLDETEKEIEDKVESYCVVMSKAAQSAKDLLEEAKRLTELAKVDTATVERLKERLKWMLETRGQKRIKTSRYSVTVATNGGKHPIHVDEEYVPEAYLTRVQVESVNTEKIRQDLEQGRELQFARLGTRGTHLRIK